MYNRTINAIQSTLMVSIIADILEYRNLVQSLVDLINLPYFSSISKEAPFVKMRPEATDRAVFWDASFLNGSAP